MANRGEVWLVDLGYTAKVRPCLVISIPVEDRDRALVTVIPHTTSPRGSRFEIPTNFSYLKAGAFDAQSLVTLPQPKLLRHLGRLTPEQLDPVEKAVLRWLGFNAGLDLPSMLPKG